VIGLLFVLFGASLFFERGPQEERVLFPKGKTLRTLLLTIFFLFLYCYLIPIAGYTISTLAASICLIRMIGQYKWLFSAILGAILTTVLYSIFILLLKTPVPSGIFPI
jgi:cell division protein FtsW (lipid II flippase)